MRMVATTVVTTAASPLWLTTLANAKADLGISGSTEDAYLNRRIAAASSAIERHCNRVFARQTYTTTFRLPPGQSPTSGAPLVVPRAPVVSITSIVEDSDDTAISASLYQADLDAGLVYRVDSLGNLDSWGFAKAVAVYVAGYLLPDNVSPTLPSEIEDATIALVKAMRHARERDPLLKSDQVDGLGRQDFWVSTGDSSEFPEEVRRLLEPHVLRTFG